MSPQTPNTNPASVDPRLLTVIPTPDDLDDVAQWFKGNLMTLGEARKESQDSFHERSLEKYFAEAAPALNNLKQIQQQLKNMSPNNYPIQPNVQGVPNVQPTAPYQQPPMPPPPQQYYPPQPMVYPAQPLPQQAPQQDPVMLFSMIYNEIQKVNNTIGSLIRVVEENTEELKKLKKSGKASNNQQPLAE